MTDADLHEGGADLQEPHADLQRGEVGLQLPHADLHEVVGTCRSLMRICMRVM